MNANNLAQIEFFSNGVKLKLLVRGGAGGLDLTLTSFLMNTRYLLSEREIKRGGKI